jgi:putative ABC transport system permease protein
MIRHLLKPLWKRKGRNLLLSLEIMLAFAVVFAIAAAGLRYWQLYHQPIGFEWQDVWSVELRFPESASHESGIDPAVYAQLQRAAEQLPPVEKTALAAYTPYENSEWNTSYWLPVSHRKIDSNLMKVSDGFFDTMGVKVIEGRGFSIADDGAARQPVLVSQRFAREAFPGRSALGQHLAEEEFDGKAQKPGAEVEVVGVFDTFRNQGEYMAPKNFLISRFAPPADKEQMRTLLLRMRPGTPRAFESSLLRQLKGVRNDWSYRITPLADARDTQLRMGRTPLVLLSVIAAFLLLMVAFGLFGVLWQNTTRRTGELGLRRAVGASAGDITLQIVLEQVLLCLLPIAAALLLLVQLPITGALGEALSWPLFAGAALLAAVVMVLVSVGCALYPAWRASRLSPTEALHYE